MKLIILLLTSFAAFGQIGRPTYNPFNNGAMPFYGGNQFMMPNQGFQFPNNTNHPLNFHRPNNFGYQSNFQQQPQQATPLPTPLFTRRFHLNNGYLFGRPTLYLDPKTGKMQPWVRKNLR